MYRNENITGSPAAARIVYKRRKAAAFIYRLLFVLLIYIVQAFVLPYIKILPSIPFILPLWAVGAAMIESPPRGAAVGLLAGVLCDISMNQPAGQFALFLTLICLGIGILSQAVLAHGLLTYIALCGGTLIVCSFLQMFTLLFFDEVPLSHLAFEAGRQLGVSMPFALPLYFLSKAFVVKEH